MRYVLDSSVAFKWLVPETDSDKALRMRDDFRNRRADLLSPEVFPVEVAHALTRAERQGRVTPARGLVLLKDLLASLSDLHVYMPLLPRAYEISSLVRIGVYDCPYVALAEREGCELLTADDRLVRVLRPLFPSTTPLSSLP